MNQKTIAARFGREVATRVYFDGKGDDSLIDEKTARIMMFAMADALTDRSNNIDLYNIANEAYYAAKDMLQRVYK